MNLDTVSFTVTAPGAAGAACTVFAGDSANVKNAVLGSNVLLLAAWTKSQAVGFSQITAPSFSDVTRGIRYRHTANLPVNALTRGFPQGVQPQELFSVTQAGSAVAGDVEIVTLMLWYDNLPGINPSMLSPDQARQRLVRLVTIEDTITPTVASTYSGGRALNAASDLLHANTDYVLLGARVGVACGALTVRGPDTGNVRVPFPGNPSLPDAVQTFLTDLGDWNGLQTLPIINSANKAATIIEVTQDENLTAVPFNLVLGELSPS